jgi:hypothetical protein
LSASYEERLKKLSANVATAATTATGTMAQST